MFNEVKADKHTITQDDIDQAISYARLVHPIAHFCMVTNGKEQQCFHPITKEPVPEENFPFLNFKGHQSDSNAYFEALEHFMGYSEENLLNFCKQQHIEYMKQLKESKERPALAFIPELYQPSNKLSEAFSKFLQSDSKLFAVIADSGKGKTNWICHEATKFLEEKHAV